MIKRPISTFNFYSLLLLVSGIGECHENHYEEVSIIKTCWHFVPSQ